MGKGKRKPQSNLAAYRKHWDLSQAELAKEVGISQGELSKIEAGMKPDVDPELLIKLAGILRFAEHPEALLLDAPLPKIVRTPRAKRIA